MPRPCSVTPHDPNWALEFQREAERLRAILGAEVAAAHHIGSTAIPHILAKPIIDALLEVRAIEKIDSFNPVMIAHGYEPRGDLALTTAVQEVKRPAARPTTDELIEMSEARRPWRAVAARLLWHYSSSQRNGA